MICEVEEIKQCKKWKEKMRQLFLRSTETEVMSPFPGEQKNIGLFVKHNDFLRYIQHMDG